MWYPQRSPMSETFLVAETGTGVAAGIQWAEGLCTGQPPPQRIQVAKVNYGKVEKSKLTGTA